MTTLTALAAADVHVEAARRTYYHHYHPTAGGHGHVSPALFGAILAVLVVAGIAYFAIKSSSDR